MPSVPQTKPVGGIWALGIITLNHGTPIAITNNVGSQESVPLALPTGRPFSGLVKQITFVAPTANSGDVFVQYGSFAGPDTNATVLSVPKGTSRSLPEGSALDGGLIDVNRFYVDGTTSDTIIVFAVLGN